MKPASQSTLALDQPSPGIARITLSRAAELNTLTFELIEELHARLAALRADPPRALILTGSGRAFCGGAHVTYFTEPVSSLYGNHRAIRDS